jgi:hypothetical protein
MGKLSGFLGFELGPLGTRNMHATATRGNNRFGHRHCASRAAAGWVPCHLIGAANSLLAHKNSLFRRVGNLARKTRKSQGKFGTKIAQDVPFYGNSLLNPCKQGIPEEWQRALRARLASSWPPQPKSDRCSQIPIPRKLSLL